MALSEATLSYFQVISQQQEFERKLLKAAVDWTTELWKYFLSKSERNRNKPHQHLRQLKKITAFLI